MKNTQQSRCAWVTDDPLSIDYHDNEWGRPLHDNQKLFEFLILEGAQAGLSWITILKRREGYRQAFDAFSPELIANYTEKKITALMNDAGIIRNRLKIQSAINNAKAYLKLQESEPSFSEYLWSFVDGKPIINHWKTLEDIPASTQLSEQLSKDLKKHGFSFVGPTICYTFMQATGMVNDHTTQCHLAPK